MFMTSDCCCACKGVAMKEKLSRAAAIEKEMMVLETELKAKVKELRAFYAEYQQKWDRA